MEMVKENIIDMNIFMKFNMWIIGVLEEGKGYIIYKVFLSFNRIREKRDLLRNILVIF